MRSAATLVIVAVAVLVQATAVNRVQFDWGPGPDLVVAALVAVALTTTPAVAASAGFAAGLAMDLLPPAEHAVGRYALVLCVAAYLVALLRANTGSPGAVGAPPSAWTGIGVTAVTSLGVGLGYAAVGLVMGDPRVSLGATAVAVGVGTVLTTLVSPLVTVPLLWIRNAFTENEFATIQGPTGLGGW
ncbi:rod shape-determining protein MreD [Nocardiopsis sp. EMB25]|uniref:rod shape-determining protein MreD n=1 Tax=Nocardiopsis TaxID=2013 RepID=UPI00034C9321|nr:MULTISPECIES: rod shape-determining protein MreD [Nocardiopsis]MCY9785099.1 rod shape-determining protein MreD [Nocardiopsis sp. EMB25]